MEESDVSQGSDPSKKNSTASGPNKNAHEKDQEEEKQSLAESSTRSSSGAITVKAALEESKK
jgi:hypothetical protein